MSIYLNLFSNYVMATFKEKIGPTLTAQQRKIFLVASFALGFGTFQSAFFSAVRIKQARIKSFLKEI